jgi:phage terminase small subunit
MTPRKAAPASQARAEAKLKARQQAFVEHYIECLNAAEAARRAGYSVKTARQQGSRLLSKVDIRQAVEARLAEIAMGPNEVLARLSEMASSSMEDFINADKLGVRVVDLRRAAQRGKLHLVKKVSETQHGLAIELHDPQAALVQLGRYHKLFVDRQEHTGANGGPIQLEDVKAALLARFAQADAANDAAKEST